MKTDLNKLFSTLYRWVAVFFLLIILVVAVGYASMVGFYAVNTSWSAPLTLSPTQEKVLRYQPQITTMETTLDKQIVELKTTKQTIDALSNQVAAISGLIGRITKAMSSEAVQLANVGQAFTDVLADKKGDIEETDKAIAEIRGMVNQIDAELEAKLITTEQAAQRKLALQNALNSATDAKAAAIQLEQSAKQAKSQANTMRGGASSLSGVTAAKQLVELKVLLTKTEIELTTAIGTSEALTKSIVDLQRVINNSKQSPYHKALNEDVYVAFLPYGNADDITEGDKMYDCYLHFVGCYEVGTVGRIYTAEEYARHPLFKTDLKGRFIELKLSDLESAKSEVLFVGGKPLLF